MNEFAVASKTSASDLDAGSNQAAKEKFRLWSHPDWDNNLVLELADDAAALGYADGCDVSLLKSQEVEMTRAEFDALGEFEG